MVENYLGFPVGLSGARRRRRSMRALCRSHSLPSANSDRFMDANVTRAFQNRGRDSVAETYYRRLAAGVEWDYLDTIWRGAAL